MLLSKSAPRPYTHFKWKRRSVLQWTSLLCHCREMVFANHDLAII